MYVIFLRILKCEQVVIFKKSNYKLIVKTTWSIQQNLNTNIMTDWINGDKHLGLMIILGGNEDTKNVIEY